MFNIIQSNIFLFHMVIHYTKSSSWKTKNIHCYACQVLWSERGLLIPVHQNYTNRYKCLQYVGIGTNTYCYFFGSWQFTLRTLYRDSIHDCFVDHNVCKVNKFNFLPYANSSMQIAIWIKQYQSLILMLLTLKLSTKSIHKCNSGQVVSQWKQAALFP